MHTNSANGGVLLLPKDLFPCRSFEVFEALNSKVSRLVVILLMAKIRRSPVEGKVNYLPLFKQGLKDTISNPVVGVMGFLKHQQYHGNLGHLNGRRLLKNILTSP